MHYYEEAKNLSNKIGFYQAYKRKPIFHDAPEELTAENIWGASYLCSAVLQKCEQQKYHCITIDTLKDLQEEFKAETGYAVDSNELINKGWIRIVFGFVSITKAIAQAGHVAEKVQALSEELNFFLQIEKKQDHEKYTLDELNDLVLKYESSNDVKLNLDAAKAGHYWGSREQKVDLHNVSVYKIVLDNIGEFLFIEKIYQALYSDNEKHLQISGDILVAIFTNHIKVFPETPSLTEFIKNTTTCKPRSCMRLVWITLA